MKNYLHLAIVFLFTCAGYGKDLTTQSYTPTYKANSQTKENHFSERESQERSYIDTADEEQRTTSNSEKKRSSAGGTFLSVLCIIFVAVAIYLGSGDWDGLM